MDEFDNKDRNRYYGLRVGDTVKQKYLVGGNIIADVIELCQGDNNRVVLRLADGAEIRQVAEWCEIIEKVEDKQQKELADQFEEFTPRPC